MNTPLPMHLEELLSGLIDGNLSDPEREELMSLLAEDPERLKLLSTHLQVSEILSQQLPLRREDVLLPALNDHIEAVGPEEEQVFIDGLFRRIRRRKIIQNTAIAATLAALLIPITWLGLRSDEIVDPGPNVAMAILLNEAGKTTGTEGIQPGQDIHLQSGLMKLKFPNGAVVAVESPAAFKVVSETRMELFSGKLNGWCPETAHGFQVITADTTLTDLGTSFGIEAGPDGQSDFVVIEGSINLRKNHQSRILKEGKAVSTHPGSGLKNISFETSPFERTWALTSGIMATTGAVVPAKPDIPERLARLRNDSEVMVVPEVQAQPFDRPIRAEITEPGHVVFTEDPLPTQTIAPRPGVLLHSYLLRVDPESELRLAAHIHFEGSVTFDHPVIAIIVKGSSLRGSDRRFAKAKWPQDLDPLTLLHRGLEVNWNTDIHDEVTLSEDRKTVTIAFHTGASTDDIRVITGE